VALRVVRYVPWTARSSSRLRWCYRTLCKTLVTGRPGIVIMAFSSEAGKLRTVSLSVRIAERLGCGEVPEGKSGEKDRGRTKAQDQTEI
jgi:hypothetical protein